MDTTIGTSQTIITLTTNATTSAQNYYFTKFVSEPVNQTSIAANTWTYNFAARSPVSGFANYPVNATNKVVYIHVYVWRPSDGTKVSTILDGNTAATVDEVASSSILVCQATFTGAAASSIQVDDVIVCEIWFQLTQSLGSAVACEFVFDGTTANTTKNATVTNHASFIETPENISFAGGTTPVSQTSIHKYSLMQFIPQTSIQKYSLRQYLAQTSIHKYTLRNFVAITTTIQKYNLRKFLAQTIIHKYNLRSYLTQTSIHKYTLRNFLAQTSIQKYNLRNFLAQTNIHKYNLRKFLTQTSIHKYNILFSGTVIVNSIQKYNIRRYLLQTTIQKYALRVFVALTSSIQKYNLRRNVAQTNSIQKYSMRSMVLQTSTHKYNMAGIVTNITMTELASKTYANKFITQV